MRSRVITVVVALLSAVAFGLAMQSAWWSGGETDIGPFGARACFGGECRESGLARFGGADLWMRSAVATRAAGYIAMFILLMFAAARAAGREPRLVARGAVSAIVTALVCGAYFAFAGPDLAGVSWGPGLAFYACGIVAGLAAVILFLRAASR